MGILILLTSLLYFAYLLYSDRDKNEYLSLTLAAICGACMFAGMLLIVDKYT